MLPFLLANSWDVLHTAGRMTDTTYYKNSMFAVR